MCLKIDDIVNVAPTSPFSEGMKEVHLQNIYLGIINRQKLDAQMYAITVSYFMDAVRKGYGGLKDEFTYGSGLADTAASLESSIYRFSAAKQYQEVSALSKMAYNAATFQEFNEAAGVLFDEFNVNYLRTEWSTAVQQAQNARDWVDLTDNDFIKYLRYYTEKDGNVRPEHKALDGITLPKDDPFWSNYYPANGWNCRCFIEGVEVGRKTNLKKRDIPEWGSNAMPAEFKYNPGKDGLVFSDKHPYYSVARGDVDLKRRNFNLPMP